MAPLLPFLVVLYSILLQHGSVSAQVEEIHRRLAQKNQLRNVKSVQPQFFTEKGCQRQLRECRASLQRTSSSWRDQLVDGVSDERLLTLAQTTTDYHTMVKGFSRLSVRERAINARQVVPDILKGIDEVARQQRQFQIPGPLSTIFELINNLLGLAIVISDFVGAISGVELSIVIFVLVLLVELNFVLSSGNTLTLLQFIIETILSFTQNFGRSMHTLNTFSNADVSCSAELMTCNEQVFVNQLMPSLMELIEIQESNAYP